MAGILVDMSSDIQKLQQIKAEIASVKQELKGIDIRVRLDIKESVETRLKALSEQYTALVVKIAEAEGKIKLSVHNINKASEAIIQAQEKMSKVTGGTTQQSTTTPSNTSAETATIQAQAKAYEDLRTEINAVLGTREANIRRMLDEKKAIDLINAEINKITKSQGGYNNLSSSQQKRLEQLNNSLLTHKAALAEVRQVLGNNVKMDNAAATSMDALGQSLSRMRITYRGLTEEERKSPFGKELLSSINQADAKIKELDASIGNHARNVGNYKKEWNGLQYQMQILSRELPNFAINPQTGIISLTNNLPYLVDELKKAKDAHKAYIAEVKAGNKDLKEVPSVGKQILSSLFSWQTALIMGITLITAYRKEITEWVGGLFNAKDAIKSLKEAESDINEKFVENTKGLGQQIVKLRELQEKWKSLGSDINAQKKFIQDAKSDFDNLGASVYTVSDAESLLIKNTPAFIEALKLRAQAAAAKELSEEKYKEYLSKRQEALDESQKKPSVSDNLKRIAYNLFEPSTSGVINTKEQEDVLKSFQGKRIKSLMDEAEAAKVDAESYFTLKRAKEEAASEKINSILPNSKVEIQNKDFWTNQKNNAISALDAIADKQRDLLDKTVKDPKKNLYDLGIDKSIVDSYKQAIKLKSEAEKALKVYEDPSKQESAAEKLRKEQEKLKSLQGKQSKDSIRQAKDLEFEVAQTKISAMQEGSEKSIAQMNLDHQKEIETLKRNREDYLQKKIEAEKAIFEADPSNKGESFDSSTVSLSKDEKGMFKNLLESTISQQGNELAAYYKEILSKYQGYTEKRLAAQKKFQQERDALVKAGASKEALDENDYQRDETFKSIDNEFAMREDSFKAWADNITDLSLDKLRVLLVQAERELERSEFLNPNDPKLAAQRAKVAKLKETVGEKTAETNTSPNKRSQEDWQDLYKTLSKVENEFDEIGEAVGGTAGEILSAAGSITASTLKMIDGIKTLSNSSIWAISSTATAAEKAIKAVEKASVILAIIGAAMKIASEITQMIAGESQEEIMKRTVEYYNKIVDIYDQIIDKQKESIKFGYGFASIEAATKAMDELNEKTEYNRKIADASGKSGISFKDHAKDYERLAKEFGLSLTPMLIGAKAGIDTSELSKLTSDQLEYIRDNYKELWAGLRDEQRDALQAIIDAEKEGKEIIEEWQEAITGISYDSFYTEFIDTLSDMDSSAEEMAENFGEYLKKSILAAMVAKEFKGDIDNLYKMWVNAGDKESDGGVEITKDEALAIQEEQKKLTDAMLKRREEMAKVYGWESSKKNEALDSFVSQMQSAFTSLDVTAKDVSDNIYDYFRQAMINALYEKEYKSKMEELYKSFEDKSADGLSESDMAQLGAQVDQYINEMLKGVEGVNNLFADKLKDAADIQSFVDNVKSAMSSIEATAEDVTDNIFEYIRQQMVDKMFADTFQPQIEEFYKKVQAAMSDGSVTDEEKDALRKEAEKLANDITSAKDILSDTLGVTADNLKKEAEAEFKSFSDGLLSSLYSAEVTAESVAKNIADSMRQELIKAMYIEQYEPRIRAIWDKWKEYSSDGLVTDEERASIKDDINDLSKEVADAAKDISDAWTEAGDAVYDTFESFSNSIKSVLQNAETTAEDVAKNIYQFMRNALVNSMFAEQVQPQIKAWYDKYAEYMKDGAIDTTERKTLDEMIAEIQKAGMEIVDAANGLFPSLDTGAIQKAENARNEAEQEWESFSDSMLSSLYDIEASASDISDDMSEYMRKALIKAMYVNNYKPQMQKWYDEWQRAMGDDIITSEEKHTLDSMKQEMLDGMKKEADAINQMFDSMYSQEASSKGFEGMSQNEGEELNGRFTALQIAGEEIKNQTTKQTELLSSINDKLTLRDLTKDNIHLVLAAPASFGVAEQTKGIIANSYQSQTKVVFPDGKLDALTSEVSQLKDIVDEMRTNQFDKFADISEGVSIMAKNTPAMNTKLDNINSNIKKAL